jgi:hypothetical protein
VKTLSMLVIACALGGCLRKTEFACATDAECAPAGVCEAVRFCSFADTSCTSGRRFGTYSGDYADQCVGDALGDAGIDQIVARPFCDSAGEPALVGCWELEGTLDDASGDGNNGTGTNVTYGQGKVGMAAQLGATSHIAVADSASLTSPAITLEAWMHPTSVPTGASRMGIIDNNGQYGMFLTSTGVTCVNGASATVAISPGAWTHVACTYDGATAVIYVNGSVVAMTGGGAPLGAGDTAGTALGGNSPSGDTLVGMIDQVRIWNDARTAQFVCTAAGNTSCP